MSQRQARPLGPKPYKRPVAWAVALFALGAWAIAFIWITRRILE